MAEIRIAWNVSPVLLAGIACHSVYVCALGAIAFVVNKEYYCVIII